MEALTEGGPGLVAVAWRFDEPGSGGVCPAVWISSDGLAWSPVDLWTSAAGVNWSRIAEIEGPNVTKIIAGGSGLVMVGSAD